MSSTKAADEIKIENFLDQEALPLKTFSVHLPTLNPDLLKEIGQEAVVSSIGFYNYAVKLFNKRCDIPRAIHICMESAKLGNKEAERSLMYMMNAYSVWLFNGEEGVKKIYPKQLRCAKKLHILAIWSPSTISH